MTRCFNPKFVRYSSYGGRGITVCDEWRGRDGYARFLADVGRSPSPKHSIDRIDNDGNYEPGNVRWATPVEQMRNTRSNRLVTAFGRTQCVTAWGEELGLNRQTICHRLARGLSVEQALSSTLSSTPLPPPRCERQPRARRVRSSKYWSPETGVRSAAGARS